MCIIIERDKGFEIPWDKFKPAVENNPDGMGLMFPEADGKLTVIRTPDEQDPEQLYRMVNEELIDTPLTLHLRYTTAGATNLRNAHPFPVLERATDGVDLRMCHNGTISEFKTKDSDESDTRRFVREVVRPLFKRMAKIMEPEEMLSDPLTSTILSKMIPGTSCLSFRDGNNNTMTINETGNGGKREEGWWYSNTYSFRDSYRKPSYAASAYPGRASNSSTAPMVSGERLGTASVKFSTKHGVTLEEMYRMNGYALDKVLADKSETRCLVEELLFAGLASHLKVRRLERELATERKKK